LGFYLFNGVYNTFTFDGETEPGFGLFLRLNSREVMQLVHPCVPFDALRF